MREKMQKAYASIAETKSIMSLRLTANRAAILFLTLTVCFSVFAAGAMACTAIYAGRGTTANGSVFMGRSEDYGPDFVKHFVIIPAADHKPGEMIEEDHGFRVPYPAHTLRYSAVMDDPSKYKVQRSVPFGEAGVNEKGVSVSATVTTRFNEKVRAADPLTAGGITEMSIASYILQSAESAMDGVRLLAECIDKYGHGSSGPDKPDCCNVSTVLIADREETWIFEVVSGHQYIAKRMSDDTVSVIPNDIMTQQINVRDRNIIASPGLISTAKKGGFYVSDVEGADEINVARSYAQGYKSASSYRFYYGAYILNKELAEKTDVSEKPVDKIRDLYPNASVKKGAVGPFCLEYRPSGDIRGRIGLMTLRQVMSSHGEGTAYETTAKDVTAGGVSMRSIGTYRQIEEHLFEIRKESAIPLSVSTIEWLAMGPMEFSVFVPFYSAAMTETPSAYKSRNPDKFDSESIYWLFNEIGNAGNGSYYRKDDNGKYHDRNGNEIDAETAEAVLQYLSESDLIKSLHDHMRNTQAEVNAKSAADDKMMVELAKTASDEEVAVRANQLANENAVFIRRIASEKLAEIDDAVSAYIRSRSQRKKS